MAIQWFIQPYKDRMANIAEALCLSILVVVLCIGDTNDIVSLAMGHYIRLWPVFYLPVVVGFVCLCVVIGKEIWWVWSWLVHSLSHVCYAIQFNVLMSTRSRSISWIISRKFFWRIRDFLFCSITCICTFYSVNGIWDSLVPRFHPHSRCDTWEQGNRIC